MLDPLSATAAFLAILDTSNKVWKFLIKIQALKSAPADLSALNNELCGIKVAVQEIEQDFGRRSNLIQRQRSESVIKDLENCRKTLLSGESLIAYRLTTVVRMEADLEP